MGVVVVVVQTPAFVGVAMDFVTPDLWRETRSASLASRCQFHTHDCSKKLDRFQLIIWYGIIVKRFSFLGHRSHDKVLLMKLTPGVCQRMPTTSWRSHFRPSSCTSPNLANGSLLKLQFQVKQSNKQLYFVTLVGSRSCDVIRWTNDVTGRTRRNCWGLRMGSFWGC